MKVVKTIILLILIAIIGIFAYQNNQSVKLSFVTISMETTLSISSIAFYIFGALSGGIVFSMLKKITKKEED
jgi:uncharacterized integral membrane protein